MLSSVPSDDVVIVADLEAGIGTLTRLPDKAVDVTLVVVEPTPRSIDVAQRAVKVAAEKDQGRVVIVANKITDDIDETRIRDAFADNEVVLLPADPVVSTADRQGLSPVDVEPNSPVVAAIAQLGRALLP